MNGCLGEYWRGFATLAVSAVWLTAAAPALAEPSAPPTLTPPPARSSLAVEAIAAAQKPAPYPSFKSIPSPPTDLRPVKAWRAAVLDTKAAGARIAELAAREPWTLSGSEAWAAEARREAKPPPPMTQEDTADFVAAMRARATPPPRPR